MKGFMQVISREMIKPTSQTPLHSTKLKLSCIDKFLAPFYVPLIFFYEADEARGLTTSNHLEISQRLKDSLSHSLTSFYPLAGRLRNNHLVECSDEGVEFIEARARVHLKDSIYMDEQMKQYLPWDCATFYLGKGLRLMLIVQITFFDCGGVAIAAGFSHAIADLASAMVFLHSWAAAFRGEGETAAPQHCFGTTTHFPTLNLAPYSTFLRPAMSCESFITKRLVFDKKKLNILREAATSPSECGIKDPSRVELVSSFIWKHFMAARLGKGKNPRKIYAAFHAVNVRPRTSPPRIFENVFANCFIMAMAFLAHPYGSADDHIHLHELVARLRSSIRRVRGRYITKPLNKESYMKDVVKLGFLLMMGKVEWCFFTSWLGFSTYELDFGWGEPVWFTTPSMPVKNSIILVSSKNGEDVEAIVTMMPNDIQILEDQINLISSN